MTLNLFGEEVPDPLPPKPKMVKPKRSVLDPPVYRGPAPPPPPVRATRTVKVPMASRPGTKLSKKSYALRAVRDGETRFIGTIDPVHRVYQRGIDLRHFVLQITNDMMFGYADEWMKIEREVGRIEHVDLDHVDPKDYRVYVVSTSVARRLGRLLDTPQGKRWGVPLTAFDVVLKDGTVEKEGTT